MFHLKIHFLLDSKLNFHMLKQAPMKKTTTTTPYRIASPEGIGMVWPFVGNVNALWQVHHTTLQPNPCRHAISDCGLIRWFQVPSTITTPKSLRDFRSTPPKHGGFEDELPLWKGMTVRIPAVFGAGKYLKISSLKVQLEKNSQNLIPTCYYSPN